MKKKVFTFSTSNIHAKLGFIILEFLEKWDLSLCSTVIEQDILIFKVKLFREKERKRKRKYQLTY